MLAECGAGDPESLFYARDMAGWAKGLDVPRQDDQTRWMEAICAAAVAKGRGDTPVFGLRQQASSFPALCGALGETYPDEAIDLTRLTRALGPLKFVYLRRDDKLRQAVSLCRAMSSGVWHVNHDGSDYERLPPSDPNALNVDEITMQVQILQGYDAAWNNWFAGQGITPLILHYETLAEDPIATLTQVLDFLGMPASASKRVTPPLKKLSDEATEAWVTRMQTAQIRS
ncbi:hypothetical protein AIOL_002712 [Candidatus Rhodobacter oscarellae]|uniref:Sulphotransferase Stf0 domain-containing protein n=2 Tax=Candidatus Rhodobacter oscarellae TaxID=1675527 RepID=A0A0J9E4N0_9RHOB|nr:hypothetical protein AIOL_002712 [Candidatus Rhodobacter lobularis]